MAADPEVDRLYQLPLAEFTAARNALAASRGKAGAAIKALVKPSVAAWAVNQLHWRHRDLYEALLTAAAARKAAHGRLLSGREADVAAAEVRHQATLKDALNAIRTFLKESGDPASPATIVAVTDTLGALPGAEPPGRLTKAIKPAGFEALVGLVRPVPRLMAVEPASPPSTGPASGSSSGTSRPRASRDDVVAARRAAEAARRDAQARKRDATTVEKQLRAARAAERLADAAFARARQELARAERERGRLEDQLKFVTKQAQDLVEEIRRAEQALARAASDRAQLERRLGALKA